MSTSQLDRGFSTPSSRLDDEGYLQYYIPHSDQDDNIYAEQDDELDPIEGSDVSDNADIGANESQQHSPVADEGIYKLMQAPHTMDTSLIKRPLSGGTDPSEGYRMAAAVKRPLDLFGKPKGQASQKGRVGEKGELPSRNDELESYNHPDLENSLAKAASGIPQHPGGTDQHRLHTDTARAGARNHVQERKKSFSQISMQSKENKAYLRVTDGSPVRDIDPRAAQLKVPHKTTKRKDSSKNSAKHQRGSKAGQIVSALPSAGGLSNTVNENQILVVDGKCPDGFAGDIFQPPAESRPRSPPIELDAPGETAIAIEDQTEPALSLPNEASTGMETGLRRALLPVNLTRNSVVQNHENIERFQEVREPAQDTAPVAIPGLLPKLTPIPDNLVNDFNPQSPPADQPGFTDARQLGGEAPNIELRDRPDSHGNPRYMHPAMHRRTNEPASRAPTPQADPSIDMHRVSARHGPTKVGKSKRKARPGPKRASEEAVPQMPVDDDESGIMNTLKILAWKLDRDQHRKAQASEAAARALENKVNTLIIEKQVVSDTLDRAMQERDALAGTMKERDKVVKAKEQQIKKMEKFINGISNDVEQCKRQQTSMWQKCEELEKDCAAYRVEREHLQQMEIGNREKMAQLQRRLTAVGREASSEIERLNQCQRFSEIRIGELSGVLSEERDRCMKLHKALEAVSKNHRVLRDTKQNQQAILVQLRDVRDAITESRTEDAAAKEKLDECLHLVQTMQAADIVQPSDIQKLEDLMRPMTENVFARLEELRLGGEESMAAQSSIRTCLEQHLEALKADLVTTQSLKDQHAVVRECNAALTERSATLESSMSQLRLELNDAKVRENSLSEKLIQLETEKAALQHELESGGVLSLRLQDVERLNVSLQSDLEKAKSELSRETEKLQDREVAEESMRNELEGLQAADDLDAVRAELSTTANKMRKDATMDLENKVHQATQAITQLEAKLKAAQDECASYKSKLNTLTEQYGAKEGEISKLKEEISVKDQRLADAQGLEETAKATRETYVSEVEKLRTDSQTKAAKLQAEKDREIEVMRHQLSSLQAAKDESDQQAENLHKNIQAQQDKHRENLRHETGLLQQQVEAALKAKQDLQCRLENSRKQLNTALQEQHEGSRAELEEALRRASAAEAANVDLHNKILELERQAEATWSGEHTRHQAGIQTKTPPNTTKHQPKTPRRKAHRHSTHNENVGRGVERVDQPAPVRAGSQYEERHTNEPATLSETEAELTNMSQLETVDENGISQVSLRETVPETQYESIPTRFGDFNQGMSISSPIPPRGGQSSYNPSMESRLWQPVAGNTRLPTLRGSLPPKSPPVRPNTASKITFVKPQHQSQTSSFEASDSQRTVNIQPESQHRLHSVAESGHGDNASLSGAVSVQSSPDFVVQRLPAGSHKVTKQHQITYPSNRPGSGSQAKGVEQTSKPAILPPSVLKRSQDSTQQAASETPKRAKLFHEPGSVTRSSREGSRYATPRTDISKTYPAQQAQTTQTSNGTSQSSQSLGTQSLLRSSAPKPTGKKLAGKGPARKRTYNTRSETQFAERFSQELD